MPCGEEPYYNLADPPEADRLDVVADAALGCRACHLWRCGTQTVFGEGPAHAKVVMVGEQPGDHEDLEGRPFVGPAGKLLDEALVEAGLDRKTLYLTNAVKHFKWEPKGARRLHAKPNNREVRACYPWLQSEIELIRPALVVCLGATAAQALLGSEFRVTKQRGDFVPGPFGRTYFATVHPSSILRAIGHDARESERKQFVGDLATVAEFLRTNISSRATLR